MVSIHQFLSASLVSYERAAQGTVTHLFAEYIEAASETLPGYCVPSWPTSRETESSIFGPTLPLTSHCQQQHEHTNIHTHTRARTHIRKSHTCTHTQGTPHPHTPHTHMPVTHARIRTNIHTDTQTCTHTHHTITHTYAHTCAQYALTGAQTRTCKAHLKVTFLSRDDPLVLQVHLVANQYHWNVFRVSGNIFQISFPGLQSSQCYSPNVTTYQHDQAQHDNYQPQCYNYQSQLSSSIRVRAPAVF